MSGRNQGAHRHHPGATIPDMKGAGRCPFRFHGPFSASIVGGLIIVALLGTTGCAVFGGGGHEYGDSSLSDAAKEARRDSTRRYRSVEDKPLDVGYRSEPPH